MEGSDIVFGFSIIVFVLVGLWAFFMIRAYNRFDKN